MLEDGGAEDTMSLRSREKMRMRKISVEAGISQPKKKMKGKRQQKDFFPLAPSGLLPMGTLDTSSERSCGKT